MNIHTHIAGIKGTHTMEEIDSLRAQGNIRPNDLYWKPGMSKWEPIHNLWRENLPQQGGTSQNYRPATGWETPLPLTEKLATWLRRFSWTALATIPVGLLAIGLMFANMGSISQGQFPAITLLAFIPLGLLGIATFIFYIVCAVYFCLWTHQVVTNSIADGNTNLPGSATLAVWSYFIPLASLVLPYLFLKKVYLHEEAKEKFPSGETPSIINSWWACAVLSSIQFTFIAGIAVTLLFVIIFGGESVMAQLGSNIISLIANIAMIASGFLGARAVELIGSTQAESKKLPGKSTSLH